MKVNGVALVVDCIVLTGLLGQCWGLYTWLGAPVTSAIMGTELMLIGLLGVMRAG